MYNRLLSYLLYTLLGTVIKSMDIIEIKIVLDWAQSNLDKDKGSKITFPEKYEESLEIWKKVKSKFDEECKRWVSDNCA